MPFLPAAFESVLLCLHRRFQHIRLGGEVTGRGLLSLAPMVKDLGNMADAVCPFHQTEDQIIILRTFIADAQSAELLDHRPAEHRKMTGVHQRHESVRRPVRFEKGIHSLASVFGNMVFICVDIIKLRILI